MPSEWVERVVRREVKGMSQNRRTTDGSRIVSKSVETGRRNLLRGIGALGLGSAAIGGVQARPDHAGSGSAAEPVPISAQFWSFNNADLTTAELIYEMEKAGYDHFEPFSIDGDSDVDAITEAIDETGVGMASAHQGLYDTLDDPEGVAELYLQYGEPALIEAYINGDTWSTEESVLELAHDVNTAADEMADHGLEFGYHNHDHEFQELEDADEIAYDVFAEAVEDHVHLQLDVGWVETGGANPIEYISRYSDEIDSIHMKNMRDGDFVEIDEGDVNMKAVANVARATADVEYLVYEYDWAPEPIESMNIGGEFLGRWNGPPRGRN